MYQVSQPHDIHAAIYEMSLVQCLFVWQATRNIFLLLRSKS